jgi:hypothetical protein
MYILKRQDNEVDEVLNKAAEAVDEGTSQWPGMSYEQGVQAALDWILGHTDENPMED